MKDKIMKDKEMIREEIKKDFSIIRDKKNQINKIHADIEEIELNAVHKIIRAEMIYCLKVNHTVLNRMRF